MNFRRLKLPIKSGESTDEEIYHTETYDENVGNSNTDTIITALTIAGEILFATASFIKLFKKDTDEEDPWII